MLALAFLNPLLLWALPLAAVPIIIHILNRRRFKKVPWAAMEFLLRAMKRNRKRMRLEQWIVLLLRVLAVLLLAMLVARPQLGGGGLIGTRTHHVVVLDDSASMTQRSGSATLFDRAQDRVKALADDLAKTRTGDVFSIVRTSHGTQPDLWNSRVGPDLGKRISQSLKEWRVDDGSPDLGKVVQDTQKRAAAVEEAARTHYYLVTDQRAWDFTTADDKPRPALQQALGAMDPTKEHLTVLGIGGDHNNLAVVGVKLIDRMAVANVPVALAIEVKNFGLDATMPTTVSIEVDGQSRITQPVAQLAPGQKIAVPITHTFGSAGFHRVEAVLEATERFPTDDHHAFALEVREKSRVLLVDGDPDEQNGETYFLQTAFDPDDDGRFGIEVQVVSDTGITELELAPFDYLWLCNVQTPSAELVKRIEDFVVGGGGLTIFCGPLVDAERYNEVLWRDGKGLLPLPLGEIDGDPDRPEPAVLVRKDHPICERLGDVYELLMNRVVLVYRWLTIDDSFEHEAAVIARVRDTEGPPLIVSRSYGSGGGEVTMLAITADKHWSNFPITDLFLPAVMEMHRFAARRRDVSGENLQPDGIYRHELDSGVYRADVTVRALAGDGDQRTFTAAEAEAQAIEPGQPAAAQKPLQLTVPMSELRDLGAYEVEFSRHDGLPEKRVIARNMAAAESRLVGFNQAAFKRIYPAELHDRITFVAATDGIGSGPGEGEIWQLLAAALVVGLLLESLLAWRFGRR